MQSWGWPVGGALEPRLCLHAWSLGSCLLDLPQTHTQKRWKQPWASSPYSSSSSSSSVPYRPYRSKCTRPTCLQGTSLRKRVSTARCLAVCSFVVHRLTTASASHPWGLKDIQTPKPPSHACICARTRAHTYIHARAHIPMHTCTPMRARAQPRTPKHTCAGACTHSCTCMYTLTHAHAYAHTRKQNLHFHKILRFRCRFRCEKHYLWAS